MSCSTETCLRVQLGIVPAALPAGRFGQGRKGALNRAVRHVVRAVGSGCSASK